MKFQHILVPYDGSDQSKRALKLAVDLAEGDTTVEVVKIVSAKELSAAANYIGAGNLDINAGGTITSEIDDVTYRDTVQKAVAKIESDFKEQLASEFGDAASGLTAKAYPSNDPARRIVEISEASGCDLIVMGRRGLGSVRAALGSVSTAVLRESDLAVLTVK